MLQEQSKELLKKVLKVIPENGFLSNMYLLRLQGHNILIDASQNPGSLGLATLGAPAEGEASPPKATILLTHAHFDHVNSVEAWHKSLEVPVHLHEEEVPALKDTERNGSAFFGMSRSYGCPSEPLHDGQIIKGDASYSLQVIHTPGHTSGSACYLLRYENEPLALFSGDTVFAQGIGRSDLPTGSSRVLSASLRRLREMGNQFPEFLRVYPGHGPSCNWQNLEKANWDFRFA